MATITLERNVEELVKRGRAIYDERLKVILEPLHNGEIVAIHLDSGDYEIGQNSPSARFSLRDRHPDGAIVTRNIGLAGNDLLTKRIQGTQLMTGQSK